MTAIYPDFVYVPVRGGGVEVIPMSKKKTTLADRLGPGWSADGDRKAVSPCGNLVVMQNTVSLYPDRQFSAYILDKSCHGETAAKAVGMVIVEAARDIQRRTDVIESVMGWAGKGPPPSGLEDD